MSEAIKTFQALDRNSKIFLIIIKGKPAACFEKVQVYVYKVFYFEKDEMKNSKYF